LTVIPSAVEESIILSCGKWLKRQCFACFFLDCPAVKGIITIAFGWGQKARRRKKKKEKRV
jgi:hypothetical protein